MKELRLGLQAVGPGQGGLGKLDGRHFPRLYARGQFGNGQVQERVVRHLRSLLRRRGAGGWT